SGPNWLFNIDALTKSINYKSVVTRNQSNGSACTKACDNIGKTSMETVPGKDYILLPLWTQDQLFFSSSKDSPGVRFKPSREEEKKDAEDPSSTINATNNEVNDVGRKLSIKLFDDLNMPNLEDISIFKDSNENVFSKEADLNNMESTFQVSPIPITRIHKDHPLKQVIEDLYSAPQIRIMKEMCTEFKNMMHKKFQMSSIRELTFFLGLQVKQKEDGIFINQDKYVNEILNKFGFSNVKTVSTPMETHKTLLKDEKGEDIDEHLYRSMIGSLMYLTSSRPNIMFAICAYERFQVNPKISHLHAMKKIFRYLKGQPKLGLWYPKDSPFNLVAYTNSDYEEKV
nr:putative ribonuclease H-like domain-containing protein [Tanacetum cinerariifolium]